MKVLYPNQHAMKFTIFAVLLLLLSCSDKPDATNLPLFIFVLV